jgi:hypothetical protein
VLEQKLQEAKLFECIKVTLLASLNAAAALAVEFGRKTLFHRALELRSEGPRRAQEVTKPRAAEPPVADDTQRPIVVAARRKRRRSHGRAWKIIPDWRPHDGIFSLMWLLGSTSKSELEGISEYFKTPLKVAISGGSASGTRAA